MSNSETLNALCGLAEKTDLEGHSLVPQLHNVKADRPWPAITTNNHDNHAIRTKDWRYIRYADGSEELYDLKEDPNEWHNLGNDSKYGEVVDSLQQWIPKENKLPHVGNYQRILEYKDGQAIWQGDPIHPEDPIPGL